MSEQPNTKRSWEDVTCKELADWYSQNGWSGSADQIKNYAAYIARWSKEEDDERTDD